MLAGVVTRSPVRRAEVAEHHPGVPVFDSVADLVESGVDAITVCTPAATHTAVTDDVLQRGIPVVCDKPFALNAEAARHTVELAERAGVLVTAYQNRRWDSDLLTVRRLLDAGELGEVRRFESAFERWAPTRCHPRRGAGCCGTSGVIWSTRRCICSGRCSGCTPRRTSSSRSSRTTSS